MLRKKTVLVTVAEVEEEVLVNLGAEPVNPGDVTQVTLEEEVDLDVAATQETWMDKSYETLLFHCPRIYLCRSIGSCQIVKGLEYTSIVNQM